MKNVRLCFLIMIMIGGFCSAIQAQPQYYNYNTNGSNNSFPFNIAGGKEVQLLYLPGNFNQPSAAPAGNIISVSFRIGDTYPLGPWTYTDFTIKMGQSTITTFATGGYYTGAMTTVYYRASVSLSAPAGGWLTITLDAPFLYDPTQSLIVDVGHCSAPGATGFSACYTAGTGNRRNWSVGGCPFVYSSQNTAVYHMGLNIVSDPPAVVTTAATGITPHAAVLNGTVNANSSSSTVSFEYGTTTSYGNTVPGVPSPVGGNSVTPVSAAIAGLTANTLYHFRVVATNAAGTSYGDDLVFISDPLYYNYNTNGSNNSFPFNISSGKDVQLLYLPGEFNQPVVAPAGNITGISFKIGDSYPLGPWTYTDFTIKMGQAAMTTFSAGSFYAGPLTTVYYRASVLLAAAGGTWLTIDLDTPFAYDPAQSLIVEVGHCGAPGATGFSACFTNRTDIRRIWSVGGCPFGYGGENASSYHMGLTVDCPMPGIPEPITGPSTVCENGTGFIYSVPPVLNATSYAWTVPSGAVITAGAGTNTITVSFGTTPGDVTVCGVDACGNGPLSSLTVSIVAGPTPTISGPTSMCVNSGYYNYNTEPGMTNYVWTVSAGGTITYGQGTSLCQVNWIGSGAQTVSVNYTGVGGCEAVAPTVYPVTVDPVPAAAGTITGAATVCAGANGVFYSVGTIANALTYVWTLPPGATIASGEWTNSITVNFATDASSGNITVYGNNICGNGASSPPLAVTVAQLPADAGTITGAASVCVGDAGVGYSVPAIANAAGYEWTLPAGSTIASGANTNSITVDFSATAVSGDITVAGINSCGYGVISPSFPVTVNQIPPTPVISQNGYTLTSDAPAGNQWYLDGTAIPGATGQDYVATESGEYWCVVTLNGCSSEESNHIIVIITGTGPLQQATFTIKPVPNDGRFTVTLTSPTLQEFTVRVYTNLGTVIREIRNIEVKGTVDRIVDLRPSPNGIYAVEIQSSSVRIIKKVVISN